LQCHNLKTAQPTVQDTATKSGTMDERMAHCPLKFKFQDSKVTLLFKK